MRQRKIKEIDKKINMFEEFLVRNPEKQKGHWRDAFCSEAQSAELFAEIGCGKGRFITGQACLNSDKYFVGIEGNETVIYRALQKVEALKDENPLAAERIKFCCSYISNLDDIFEEGELSGIYLNFSDPWPKTKHEKRRLTQPLYISGYLHSLSPGGFIELKTDNTDFFAYSVEKVKENKGFYVEEIIEDISNSNLINNVETEYEHKFRNLKRKIKYLRAVKK